MMRVAVFLILVFVISCGGGYNVRGGYSGAVYKSSPAPPKNTTSTVKHTKRNNEMRIIGAKARAAYMTYWADIEMQVTDVESSKLQIKNMLSSWDGYLKSEKNSIIVIKVKASFFEKAIDYISNLGRVISKDIEAEDITDEYLDIKARLDNAIYVRDRLLLLLKRAKSVKDALEIEKELKRITETIERYKAKLSFLQNIINYSQITIRLRLRNEMENIDYDEYKSPFTWVNLLGIDYLIK